MNLGCVKFYADRVNRVNLLKRLSKISIEKKKLFKYLLINVLSYVINTIIY